MDRVAIRLALLMFLLMFPTVGLARTVEEQIIDQAINDCRLANIHDLEIAATRLKMRTEFSMRQDLINAAWSCQQEIALTSFRLLSTVDREEIQRLTHILNELHMKRDFLRQEAELGDGLNEDLSLIEAN